MTVEGFRAACILMKKKKQTADIARTKLNVQGDTERLVVFNEIFSEETKEEPTRRRGR